MKTGARARLILGLVGVATFARPLQTAAAPKPTTSPTFTIHVRNYAEVDPTTLAKAEQMASRIFAQAGLASRWADAPLSAQDSRYATTDPAVDGLSHIWVNILPASMSNRLTLPAGVSGLAPGAGPDRVLAYIFYDRLEEVEKTQLAAVQRRDTDLRTSPAALLGTAVAHEVGHILLNLDVHSKAGIMRGNWDSGVLNDIVSGYMHFTKDQGATMQAEVARRTRSSRSDQ